MESRIYALRKALKLSQKKFGEKIGLSESGVSNLESGKRNLTSSNSKLICSIFNVNENWLQTGHGEMFNLDFEDEYAYLCAKFGASSDPEKQQFVLEALRILNGFDEAHWEMAKRFLRSFSDKKED